MLLLEAIILSVISSATPLLLASSGELVVERSGVLNLGIEGMMIVGAACGFAGAYLSGSTLVGALCGILAGAALSAVFGILTLGLAVNQVAAGLALTILGVGLSGLIGAGFVGQKIVAAPHLYLPYLTDIPFVGRILFGEDSFIYFSIALIIAIWLFLYRTRAGLVLRAVGDNHTSAHALGYPVLSIRMLAVLFGGGCAGLAGAFLPLAYTPFFIPGMTAGRGWIALALVVFASWRPRTAGRRRLSVWSGEYPSAAHPGAWVRHSFAVDVVAALSCHGRCSRVDFKDARHRRVRCACVARYGVRA